jgi:hypothetical protein
MRTETTTVLTFDELNAEAKVKAIQSTRESPGYMSWDWWDSVYETFIEELKEVGVAVDLTERHGSKGRLYFEPRIFFSGFWSQGDGAQWAGEVESLTKFLTATGWDKRFPLAFSESDMVKVRVRITPGHYSHHGYMVASVDTDIAKPGAEQEANNLEAAFQEWARTRAKELYRTLEREYEDLTSDESIADHLRANDYEFTADGRRWPR